MAYDFDKYIERRGTGCAKYDSVKELSVHEELLPFWVADMDFPTAKPVLDALSARVDHGIFGYCDPRQDYFDSIIKWYGERFNFAVKKEWIVTTPGIVFAVSMAVRALTAEGDSIIIQTPVYYPFGKMVEKNGRKLITNSLVEKDGYYTIDFNDFEKKITDNGVKLFILCSPHNPVGRVWKKEELLKLAEICKKHNVTVVSDEIHSDFVWKGYKHTVFQNIGNMEDMTITCTSPSKTFNLAGLQISNIIIKNEDMRKKFKLEIDKTGYDEPAVMGTEACRAAYEEGGEWLDELKEYIEGNIDSAKEFIDKNLPKVGFVKPEGTYVIWLDFRHYGLKDEEINDIIINKAGLWLDGGSMFGKEGACYQRINAACPWSTLEKGLIKLKEAFDQL